LIPKIKADLTDEQAKVYKVIKNVVEETGTKNVFGHQVKQQYRRQFGKDMQLLLTDFCYNLVNIGPDFEAKFLLFNNRNHFEFLDFIARSGHPIPIMWMPKGKNVPRQLSGRKFCVGQYVQSRYIWDFSELKTLCSK
jgi:hypothetical protein